MKLNNKITIIENILDDYKAKNITTILAPDTNYEISAMIIVSATSNIHAKSLANNLKVNAKEQKLNYLNIEGETQGEWVLIDLGDIIIHIMLVSVREFYNLENLWTNTNTALDINDI